MSEDRKATIAFELGLLVDGCSMRWKIRHFSAYLSHNLVCATRNTSERRGPIRLQQTSLCSVKGRCSRPTN